MLEALNIKVTGVVQGVGFRPFIFRTAAACGVRGWVLNARDGVHIHAEGAADALDKFVLAIANEAPAASCVKEIEMQECAPEGFSAFEIRFSDDSTGGQGAGMSAQTTLVSPDIATCDECLRELLGEGAADVVVGARGASGADGAGEEERGECAHAHDRRFHYPFINCTNCGPRFTIIRDLPYDRKNTSMSAFEMCDECAAEYKSPANRRFHAQPDACFECGPHISFYEFDGNECVLWGRTLEESDAIIARAAQMLIWGEALAVKGLGGFHLVCDARNSAAVAQLRTAKHRGNKPFAVMMRNVADVKRVCYVSAAEEEQLTSPARPIVLLRRRAGAAAAGAESADVALTGAGQDSATNTQELKGVADGLSELGVMLPSTPVQHLLLQAVSERVAWASDGTSAGERANGGAAASECDGASGGNGGANFPILVMTSGNVCGNPIITQDAAAREKFRGIASAVLGNDREILSRFDDSVLRVLDAGAAGSCVQMVRRARGYAPLPLDVSFLAGAQVAGGAAESAEGAETAGDTPPIFATGPEQKNTCTYLVRGKAYISQHIGDLENVETYNAWLEAKARLEHLFNIAPDQALLACDAHPSYMSTQWAQQQNKKVSRVQHHHAHVAAVMAENKLEQATCGIAFDGTGYGAEGSIWGGEVLICNLRDFERFANFAYVPMPGGAACVREPLRMAYGVLHAFDLLEHPVAQEIFARASEHEQNFSVQTLDQMIDQGINTPYTSSVGRLFDAASAILGVCTHPTYQGEAAILLEAAMGGGALAEGSVAGATAAGDAAGVSVSSEGGIAPTEGDPFDIAITKNFATKNSTALDTSVLLLDAAPLFEALLNSIAAGANVATISRNFHNAFVQAIVQMAQVVQQVYGISTVALSGGVFMNRYIAEHSIAALSAQGFTVALNKDLPPNDGSISFGEAVVTYAKQHPTPQH